MDKRKEISLNIGYSVVVEDRKVERMKYLKGPDVRKLFYSENAGLLKKYTVPESPQEFN